jgi:hypothetical protein
MMGVAASSGEILPSRHNPHSGQPILNFVGTLLDHTVNVGLFIEIAGI